MPVEPLITPVIKNKPERVFYIENIKVILAILVILLHVCLVYGGLSYDETNVRWYYIQPSTQVGPLILMNMFIHIDLSFVLGCFFFLAAYFIKPSYDRKGPGKFVIDRLIRLGIPLQFYGFILSPILIYIGYHLGYHIDFRHFPGHTYDLMGLIHMIDYGVLWFVAALFIFTLIYVVWRVIVKKHSSYSLVTPSAGSIVLFAVILGVLNFFVRIVLPVGLLWDVVEFRPGQFLPYIVLFLLGLIAYNNNWLNTIKPQTGKRLAIIAVLLTLFYPVFIIIAAQVKMKIGWFSGGVHWQSLLFAVWEQVIGFSIIGAMLYYGKQLWNRPSSLLTKLSRYSYPIYIFHPLVLVSLSVAFRDWPVDPALKLLVVAPLAVTGSFLLASVILLIPGVNKII